MSRRWAPVGSAFSLPCLRARTEGVVLLVASTESRNAPQLAKLCRFFPIAAPSSCLAVFSFASRRHLWPWRLRESSQHLDTYLFDVHCRGRARV
eukprot:363953-Chlamydomonas_euryale.AAC.1